MADRNAYDTVCLTCGNNVRTGAGFTAPPHGVLCESCSRKAQPARHNGSAGPLTDLDRLIKLMLMTTSPNDGEALVAMRKANSWLRSANADWEMILRGKVTLVTDPFAGLDAPPQRVPAYAPRPSAPPPPRPAPPPQAPPRPQPAPSWTQPAYAPSYRAAPRPRRAKTTLADLGLDT